MKTLRDFLQNKPEELLIQAYLSKELIEKVKPLMKKNNHKIKDVLTAALKQYLNDFGPK